jgi:hypothetical protein
MFGKNDTTVTFGQDDVSTVDTYNEFDEDTKAKLDNTLFYSSLTDNDPNDIYNYVSNINSEVYGEGTSDKTAWGKNDKMIQGTKRTLREKLKNFTVVDLMAKMPFSPWLDYQKKAYNYAKRRIKQVRSARPRYEMTPMGGYTAIELPFQARELKQIIDDYEEQAERPQTIPATIFDGVTALPAYMIEFAVGGSAAESLGISLTGKGIIAASGIRTALQPSRVASSLIDQRIKGEEGATALLKAYGDIYIENLTEAAGENVVPLLKKMPFGGKLFTQMEKYAAKIGMPKSEFISRMSTKAGWNGILGEWGEERLATMLRAIFDVDDFGAGKNSNIADRMAAGLMSDMKLQNQLAELGVLAFPFGVKMIAESSVPDTPIEIEKAQEAVQQPVEPTKSEMIPTTPVEPTLPTTEPAKPQVAPEVEKVELETEEITPEEQVTLREIESKEVAYEEGKPLYSMKRVKGKGFIIYETLTGKEKALVKKRDTAHAKLAELNERARPIEPSTRAIPKILKEETIEQLIPESVALKSSLKKAVQAAKYGYKQGVAETTQKARETISKIRLAGKMRMQNKLDALSIIKTYVPNADQWRYMRRAIVATTEANVDKLMTQINEHIEKSAKREAVRNFRNYVKSLHSKYRKGEIKLGRLPKSVADKIIKALEDIDISKLTEKKEKQLESRLEFVKRTAAAISEGLGSLSEEYDKDAKDLIVMPEHLINELDRLQKTPVSELETEDIEALQSYLDYLIKINEAKAESKQRRRMEKLQKDLIDSRNELREPKTDIKEITGLPAVFKWTAFEGAMTIKTMLGRITGEINSATKKVLLRDVVNQDAERNKTFKDFVISYREMLAKKGITIDSLNLDDDVTIKIGGQTISGNNDLLATIYAHTQADGNLSRLLKTKGLNITAYKKVAKGLFKYRHYYRVNTPTIAELRDIVNQTPEPIKKLINVFFEHNWKVQAPVVNKMSMEHQNYELARYEKYMSISREIERGIGGRILDTDTSRAIESRSRFQPRTGGTARINITPFTFEVIDELQANAAYSTMTIALENARTVLANPQWREKMRQAGMHKELKQLEDMYKRIQGRITDKSVIDMAGSKLLGNIGKSILSARISGGLVQIASVPSAYEIIEPKYFRMGEMPSSAQIKELQELDPVLWIRWEAKRFDYALGLYGTQHAFEKLLFEHEPKTDALLYPYTKGDQIAIWKIWQATQRKIEDSGLKRGTSEFQKASIDLLHEALETQPMWDTLHRSPITSSESALTRAFVMFMSARNAQLNVILRSIDDFQKGRIERNEMLKRIGGIAQANLNVSLYRQGFRRLVKWGLMIGFAALGLRKPPDEEDLKKEAKYLAKKLPQEFILNMVGLDPLGNVLGNLSYTVWENHKWKYSGFDLGRIRTGNMLMDISLDVIQLGDDLLTFTEDFWNQDRYERGRHKGELKYIVSGQVLLDDIVSLIAYGTGLPYEGPKADFVWPAKSALSENEESTGEKSRRG